MAAWRVPAALSILVVLSTGCSAHPPIQLPAIGPIGPSGAAAPASEGEEPAMTGTLVVYSEELPVSKHRSAPVYTHTGYVIFRANGQLLTKVDNHNASVESEPEAVALKAGLYQVRARAAKAGTVVVPVLISPGQRTEVFLDAEGMPA